LLFQSLWAGRPQRWPYDSCVQGNALWEGRWILAGLLILWVVALIFSPWLALPVALMVLFTLAFFRDPERRVPADESVIVSPADGLVDCIELVDEAPHLEGRAVRISIFLSIFDVHVNRAPVAGEVIHSEHETGKFLDARNPESAVKNERRTWVFEQKGRRAVVRQLTGAIARRIVAWKQVGDRVEKGERFGMIRFGSRTDLFLPVGVDLLVRKGDRVQGAKTALAKWKTPT